MGALLRHHLVASLVAGILLGAGGRLAMRVIALGAGLRSGFSAGGSLDVVAFGFILGAPVALAFLAMRDRVQTRRPWPGIALGVVLFSLLALVPPPAARRALEANPEAAGVTAVAFAVLFLVFGVALEWRWHAWKHSSGVASHPMM